MLRQLTHCEGLIVCVRVCRHARVTPNNDHPSHEGSIFIVERPVSVKNQASPFGAFGNSSRSKAMIALPSSITGAVRTSWRPR